MQYISNQFLERVVNLQISDIFDCHDIIFAIMREYPREYAEDLYDASQNGQDPFIKLHTDICKRLASCFCSHFINQLHQKRISMNCRGQRCECEMWTRI
jgi:hypothetical protein